MGKYIVKRVLQFIPVFLGVTLILFALQNIVPGDPIKLIGGDKALSPEVELQLRVRYHLVQTDEDGNAILDENGDPVQTSLVDRYLYYMNGLLHGDLGNSYQRKLPVTEIFAQKYPYTVKLAACAIVLEAIMGIGAGIISAVKRYSFWDILVTLTTSILVAVPAFWLGMLLQLFFGVILKDATAVHSPCRSRVPAVPALSIRIGCTMCFRPLRWLRFRPLMLPALCARSCLTS